MRTSAGKLMSQHSVGLVCLYLYTSSSSVYIQVSNLELQIQTKRVKEGLSRKNSSDRQIPSLNDVYILGYIQGHSANPSTQQLSVRHNILFK